MLRRFAYIVFAGLTFAAPAAAQEASTVAGRPALSTTTTQDLIDQREKWGSAPGATGTTAGEPPPPEKAVKPAPSGRYAVLPTESTEKLIAEREKWGKGPAGYEKKKVAAPRAAGAGKKKLSASRPRPNGRARR